MCSICCTIYFHFNSTHLTCFSASSYQHRLCCLCAETGASEGQNYAACSETLHKTMPTRERSLCGLRASFLKKLSLFLLSFEIGKAFPVFHFLAVTLNMWKMWLFSMSKQVSSFSVKLLWNHRMFCQVRVLTFYSLLHWHVFFNITIAFFKCVSTWCVRYKSFMFFFLFVGMRFKRVFTVWLRQKKIQKPINF